MDDNVFFVIECEFCCCCGGQYVSCMECHNVYIGDQNLNVGGTLWLAGVCDCV